MSLISLTVRDTITIERLSASQSSTGGQIRAFSTANRAGLPVSLPCRIQPLSSKEQIEFGIRGERTAWKILFSSNPTLTICDRVRFADSDGIARMAAVREPSRNLDGQSRLYRAIVEEIENEQ
jgi:hypothetical protein